MIVSAYWCRACNYRFESRSVSSRAVEDDLPCPQCGGAARWTPSRFMTSAFRPFETRNIVPDGTLTEVRSRSQLNELMRIHGIRESPLNDTAEGRADYREFAKSNFVKTKPKRFHDPGIRLSKRAVYDVDTGNEAAERERASAVITPAGEQWARRLEQLRKN